MFRNDQTPLGIAIILAAGLFLMGATLNDSVPAPLPRTGQILKYATGDDGHLRKGVTWPNPRFTENGDGTVTDNLTRLTWTQTADCDGQETWHEAVDYCNTLAAGTCGLNDHSIPGEWRLPNRFELESLLDSGKKNPALPTGHPFTDVQLSGLYYWSSTTKAADTDLAWYVDFTYGASFSKDKDFGVDYAWCVRGEIVPCTDVDGDGYGTPASGLCTYPELDCDDGNPEVNPGMTEGPDDDPVCIDTLDNDCDGAVDLADYGCVPCVDGDGDGYGLQANENCTYPLEDCDDTNADAHPGAEEICDNGIDDDCDNLTDLTDPDCCIDEDGDGYGNPGLQSCTYPETDCDDGNPNVNPGVTEGPDGDPMCGDSIDNDCDGTVDLNDLGCVPCTDVDGDGYGQPASENCIFGELDCDDANRYVYPSGFEICNDGMDNQCPGDEGYGSIDDNCEVSIPAGCFDMGDHDSFPIYDNDEPVHNVCISAFEMDVHEVTNVEYAMCVDDGGCTAQLHSYSSSRYHYSTDPSYDGFPVIYVDWYQAEAYCAWAGKRLPTEAEWEYAARGGLAGEPYPWGDTASGSDANYSNSGDPWDNDTSRVEYYEPNGYGLHDVGGNVTEWVNDWYWGGYYEVSPQNDPQGPDTGTKRVLRGGSWIGAAYWLRVAIRYDHPPDWWGEIYGFRCAR